MVDSIEIRLDQLTEAIKGLYAKSSMSQGEIYNALSGLSQRYENFTTISGEKIAITLVNEFRKTLEVKYNQTNQYIKELEASIRNVQGSQQLGQSPKLAAEISKLLSDTTKTYEKLTSQDLALQKIFNCVENRSSNNSSEEIARLSENFLNFSNGFENITSTLNKNFAEFLCQVKQHSSKEEMAALKSDLENIRGNVNSVISAISIIDTKYKDLTSLISAFQTKETLFSDAIREVHSLNTTISSLKQNIDAANTRNDIEILSNNIKIQIEAVKHEIQKIINTTGDAGVKAEIFNLTSNISTVTNNVQAMGANLASTKDEMRNLATYVQAVGGEVKNIHNLVNDEILYKTHQHQEEYEKYLNSAKEEIKSLLIGLTSFKNDITAINQGNIKILQEPIERALEELKNQDVGQNIKSLSDNLRDVSFEIQSSIQNMQMNLNDLNSASSVQILTQISEAIPTIADKLEIFRTHVVTENSQNLSQIKTSFYETISAIKENLKNSLDKIIDDTKTINIETLDTLKVDLQRLSDNLIDGVENVQERIHSEFGNFKTEFQEFSLRQQDNLDKFNERLSTLEVGLENFSQDTLSKMNDKMNAASAHNQDVLNEIKSDILENVINIDKTTKASLSQFELKVDKLLDNYIGADLDSIVNKKSLRETVIDIENKIDRTNLQQIHNAKELLEEIQAGTSNLAMKIATIEESKNIASIMSAISKINEKLQGLEESNKELNGEFQDTKIQIEQKLKDNIQKISTLLDKPQEKSETDLKTNANIDELSNKIQEYISNFEFLKNNISQEVKESLESEFSKIEDSIKKIKTSNENANYSYTLEDIESDLAKIRLTIEKNSANSDDFKTLFEKVIELRTVGLENVKINRDIETELGHVVGWFKDVNVKIDDLSQNFEQLQKVGFEDIKTRLIQSEKSKHSMTEANAKFENTLRYLVKVSQTQEQKFNELNKKLEMLAQSQNENFNPSQFIDIFYENMTQTKMLSNRVEIIEDKINSIQNAVDKLLSYVEN